jgi:hypothetical protein
MQSIMGTPQLDQMVNRFTMTLKILVGRLRLLTPSSVSEKRGEPRFLRVRASRHHPQKRYLMQLVDIPATLNALTNLALALKDNPTGAIAIVAITACTALWIQRRDK